MKTPLVRIGSISAIIGPILLLIGTFLHPMQADPNDHVAAFREYAADNFWITSHLIQFFGMFIITVGLVGLYESIKEERGGSLALLGLIISICSLSVFAVLQAVDGITLKAMVDNWVSASETDKIISFNSALAVRNIEIGIAGMFSMLSGISFLLFGLSISISGTYPKWLGWIGAIGGLASLVGGLVMAYTGFSSLAMNINMPSGIVMIIWLIIIGIIMWKKSNSN